MIGAALLCALLAPFQADADGPAPNGESFALLHGLARAGALEFAVPEGPARAAAERLAKRVEGGRELRARVLSEGATHEGDAVRAWVGSPADEKLGALALRAGLAPIPGGFRAFGREYVGSGDAAVFTYEDPEHAGRPLLVYLGNDLSRLAAYLDHVPRLASPALTLYAEGDLALSVPLALDGTPRTELARDYLARREQYFAGGPRRTLEGLTVVARAEPEEAAWREYSKHLAGAKARVTEWLSPAAGEAPPALELFLYEHPEDFAWCLEARELSLANPLVPRAHVLLAPGMPDDGGRALALVLARALAGTPEAPWMGEGLAVAAAGRWWGRPLPEWIGHLALGRLLPDVGELLAPSADAHLSAHVLAPARGFLFQLLVQGAKGDARALRAVWNGAELQPKRLVAGYQKGLIQVAKALGAKAGPAAVQAQRQRIVSAGVRHGLALVESPEASYGSRALGRALDQAMLQGVGPDAISLTVFASERDTRGPLLPARPAAHYSPTSDVDLAAAVSGARGRGARVLLGLEILAAPSGSWADSLSWSRENVDRKEFFARLARVGGHYALLAELLGVEVLCCAANLRDGAKTAPRTAPQDPRRVKLLAEGWKTLFTHLRAAYRGALTYSARFPPEAEEVGFYDQLDFVGVSLFPRLAAGVEPSAAELERMIRFELERALDLAVRWNKPLLVTHLGFPARADSWTRPWVPRGPPDAAAQQRYLAALAEVLAGRLENGAALRGFYLWNWPLDDGGAQVAHDFSLRAGSLGEVLARLFAR